MIRCLIMYFSVSKLRYSLFLVVALLLYTDVYAVVRSSHRSGFDRGQIYVGGRIGVGVPLSLGRSGDEVSFKDVVSVGFAAKADAMWMASQAIGIGGEVGFNNFPYREQYWSNTRGSFDATYHDISAGVLGRVIMGSYDLKPYFGIVANAHLLQNKLIFDSRFEGTMQDESVSYNSVQIKPGFAAECGIFYKVGKNSNLSIALRLNVLPFLDAEEMTTIDSYTYVERKVVVNPHGNQNNFEVLVGLHFGAKSDKKLRKR